MTINSVEIMKIIDERETQKTTKITNKQRKEKWETETIVKGWELNDFFVPLT